MATQSTQPVRVVHILEATEGGTRRWLEDVVLGLDPTRVQSACICSVRRDPSFQDTVDAFRKRGVDVWVTDMCREVNPLRDFAAWRQIARILKSTAVDIVHAHSAKAGALARLAARGLERVPVVYTPHAFPFLGKQSASGIYFRIEKALRRLTTKVMAVSESEAHAAHSLGFRPEQVVTLRNGVRPQPDDPRQPVSGPPVVGMVAGLRAQKDPESFIRAAALLHSRRPETRFALCGDGPLSDRMRQLSHQLGLSQALIFTGRVQNTREHLRGWQVFVLCSRFEGLPYALLEAMAAGIPLVATNVPGIAELIDDEETGLLVEPGEPEALANAVERLLSDPVLARRLSAAARVRVCTHYTLQDQLDQLTLFYEELAKEYQGAYDEHAPC